jgi:hypothetical protein
MECTSFHKLVPYLVTQVPLSGRRTGQRDAIELHDKKMGEIMQGLGAHTQAG